MFRINGYPFVDRDADCTCDVQKVKTICEAAVDRRAPFMVDKDGNKLFYVDSFGLRGRVPGECEKCYKEFIDGFTKSQSGDD